MFGKLSRFVWSSCVLLFASALMHTPAHAEGSRSLYPASYPAAGVYPDGGFRANLDMDPTGVYAGIVRRQQFLYVYVQQNEYIVLGSRNRSDGGNIFVYNPQNFGPRGLENVPANADFSCSNGALTGAPGPHFSGGTLGTIGTRANELAGPNSAHNAIAVPNGFAPCAYRAPQTGIYGVRFTVATTGGGPNGVVDPPAISNSTVSAWDVTVRASAISTANLNGRLFTYAWAGFTGGNSRSIFHELYYVTSDGYRYRQTPRGLDPNGFALYANVAGFLDQGSPLYKDIRGSNQVLAELRPVGITGVSAQPPQYPIFFSDISDGGPNEVEAERVLTALGIPLVPTPPTVSALSFAGNLGGSTSTVGAGGVFTFTTSDTFTYQIVISRDGVDFDPANVLNRVLTGAAPTGTHTVIWDGLDNSGDPFNPFPAGSYPFELRGRNGEVHFPLIDAEGNANGGPSVVKLNGPSAGSGIVYFDDRGYQTRSGFAVGALNGHICQGAAFQSPAPTPTHSLLGVDSTIGGPSTYARRWTGNGNANSDCADSGFGDAKGLDLWAYENSAPLSDEIEIVEPIDGVDVGTLVSVTSTASPGETVFGTFVFSNNGDDPATGVTYAVTIGNPADPSTCPAAVNFSLLPAGVTAVYNPAPLCSVSFTGMPTTLTPGQTLTFNFNYVVGPTQTGPVPVNTQIGASNETPGAPSPNTANAVTGIPSIDAVNDDYSSTPINGNTGGVTPSIFDNDELDGTPFVPGDVTVTLVNDGGLTGATINPDGTVTVPPGTPAGPYTLTYEICSVAQPTLCDTATITIVVVAGALDDPLACDGTFYQARQIGNSRLFVIDRSVNPYVANELYDIGAAANAMGFNPVDDHLYILRNPTTSTTALFRLGASGPVDLNGGAAGTAIAVAGLPNSNFDGGDFDEQGNYFVSQGGAGPIYRISGVTGPTPAPAAISIPASADPSPPPGYTGVAAFLIGDIAVHPTESTPARTVVYGTRQFESGTQYLYRIAIDNPSSGAPTAVVSRIATNLPTLSSAFGSLFFDVSGTLYGYYNLSDASAGFYTFDTATGNAVSVSGAESASSSDGGTCAFADQTIDVVKSAGTPIVIDATTFDVPYSLVVGNLGTEITPNVQVSDNLSLTFAAGAPTLSIVAGPTAGAPCTANAGFNGVSNFALLSGNDDLAPGASCTIGFTVRVAYASLADIPSAPQENTAYASSTSGGGPNPGYTFPGGTPVPPVGLIAADQSTDAPALPANPNEDPPSPTPVVFPYPPRVSIDKSAIPPGALTPGGNVTYTIVVSNAGLVSAPGTLVSDPLPAGLSGATWTCVAAGGAVCPNANGSGSVNEVIATFPPGSSLTWTITATVDANPPASIVNTASATPPDGLCFPGDTLPPCTDTVSNPPVPIVGIAKSASESTAVPGGTVTWSVVVSNTGNVPADGTTVSDPVPAGIDSMTWTCAAAGGAVCANANGSGAINEAIPTFPVGGQVTYTITANVSPTPPATVVNTATTTPPGGGICSDGSAAPCSAGSIVPTAPQIEVIKTANPPGSLIPGGSVTYTVTVNNAGAAAAPGTTIIDSFPAGIVSATWTCAAAGGAVCPNANSGGTITPPAPLLNETVATFPGGSSLTYTIVAAVSATPPANVINTVEANPPNGVCLPANSAPPCASTVSNPPVPVVDLDKTVAESVAIPGGTVVYTLTARNTGSVAADGTLVSDPIPGGVTAFNWTCAASGGALCPNANGSGAINETIAVFPVGSEVVWTITATVAAAPPATLANIATATPPGGGICADGGAVPCDAEVDLPVAPQISIAKSADVAVATPGGVIQWTVTVSNDGSVAAPGTLVSDPVPAGIVATTWTCTSSGGAVCPNANGSGAINEVIAIFPSGGEIVYLIDGTVATPAPLNIVNTATATPPGEGRCLPGNSLPPCAATTTTPSAPSVAIAKSVDDDSGNGIAEPGETLTYSIVLSNSGGSAATAFEVTDPLDANTTFVSADNGGTHAAGVVTWTGLTVPANGTLTLTVVVTVNTPLPAGVTEIGNLAYETGTTPPDCDVQPLPPNCTSLPTPGNVVLTKALDSENGTVPGVAEPGEQLTYTVTLSNTGGSDVTGYGVTDELDANTTFVSADNGGTHAAGVVTWTGLTVPANGSLVLTVIVTVNTPIPAGVTDIANLAYPTGTTPPACPPAGPQCVVTPTPGNVTLTKALDDENGTVPGVAEPGEQLTYTVTLTNTGGSDVTGYGVTDELDANTTFVSADNGGTHAAGVVTWTGLTVPADGSLVLTVVVTVNTPIPAGVTDIANLAYPTGTTPPPCPPAGPQCVVTPTPGNVAIAKVLAGENGSVPGVAEPGEQLTYTVTLSNTGGSDVTSYGVTDQLDANTTFVSADNGGTHAAGVVTWNGLTVPANGSIVLTVVVAVNAPIPAGVTQIANLAYQTGTTPPPCPPAGTQCVITPTLGSVTIAKTLSGENGSQAGIAEPGEQLTYAITLTNTGGSDVTGYGVTDQLDANVNFVSASNGGSHAGGVVTWTGLIVPANGNLVLTVVVTVDDPIASGITQIANLAYETGTTPPPCPPAGTQCVITPTAGSVTIAKTLSSENGSTPGVAEPGEQLTYTVTLTNTGGSDVTGYGVTDQLDANVNFVSASNGGSHAGGVVTWTGLIVPANGNLVLTVVVTVDDPIAGGVTQIANLAYETGTTPPSCPPAGTQCVITPTAGSVTIAKTLSSENGGTPGVAEPGEQLTYTITLTNTGGSDVTGYGVTDQLDANTTFVSASNGGTHAGGVVTWAGLTVPANGNLVLTVVVTVADPIPDGVTQIANLAYETGTTPPACPPAGTQCVITPTLGAVTIAKALDAESGSVAGVAEPGEQLTYTVTLTNTGGSDVTGYGVTDQLDANVTFVSASNGGTHAGGVVTWTGLTVPANGDLVLTVVVTVADPIPDGVTQIANLAYETGTTPPACPPAGSQCVITPTAGTVTIVKTAADDNGNGQAEPGETLTYTITLANTGGSDVTGFGVTDELDANTTFVSADNGGTHAAGVVTWTGLTVPANGSLVLTVVVTVDDPIADGVEQIVNLAYETGTTPPACETTPTPANCAIVPVQPVPQIAVIKTVAPSSVAPGGSVTYTVRVSNTGTVAVSNVTISDPMPAGIASFAWTCAGSGGAVCPVSNGSGAINQVVPSFPAGGELVYTVNAQLTANPPASVLNTVTVTPSGSVVCAPEGTPGPCSASTPVTVTGTPPGPPQPVPLGDRWMLLALAALLLAAASRFVAVRPRE